VDTTSEVSEHQIRKHADALTKDVEGAVCAFLGLKPGELVRYGTRTITYVIQQDGSITVEDSGEGKAPELDLDALDAVIHAADHALEQDIYSDYGLVVNACALATDAALLAGDYVLASEYISLNPFLDTDYVLNVLPQAGVPLSGTDLLKINSRGLTKYGRENRDLVAAAADIELAGYVRVNGVDPVWRIYKAIDFDNLPNSLSDLGPFFKSEKAFAERLKREKQYFRSYAKMGQPPPALRNNYDAFGRFNGGLQVKPWRRMLTIGNQALKDEVARVLRSAENRARDETGIPRVGEGWVTETELLNRVRQTLPDDQVIHHGRPPWLGRQHLDIWVPGLSVALEYQGEQHERPIEYFGGTDGLANRRKLDARKAQLCKENGCTLIEVEPGYDWPELRARLVAIHQRSDYTGFHGAT